ncbi:MAG: nucleotidyl transferase AbiEii/AbiGii toxin family protein [Elusimicrobiota bacterium]|nr:nucleotidyl transferase AbiEii/AbiGii toxin family protein [Elusimicrobiota bacterium]
MVTNNDYNLDAVEAAHSVLLEITHLLGAYRDSMVLVGGWVPQLLCCGASDKHVGSIDIDLLLDHRNLQAPVYKTIKKLLMERGYTEGEQPFIFYREVTQKSRTIRVEVDFLGAQYKGTGKKHRTQQAQDIKIRKARGADLAFNKPVDIIVSGTLPDGAEDKVSVKVASIVPFLVMKAQALNDRLKEKDSWDIYYCLLNYPGGVETIAAEFRKFSANKLVQEGLAILRDKFGSVKGLGPTHIAAFENITDPQEQERVRRDAYERVALLLKLIKA